MEEPHLIKLQKRKTVVSFSLLHWSKVVVAVWTIPKMLRFVILTRSALWACKLDNNAAASFYSLGLCHSSGSEYIAGQCTPFNRHEEKLKHFVLHLVRTVSLNFALPREGVSHADSIVWSLLLAIVDRNVTLLRNTGLVSVRIRKCLGTGF